jgi:arylsulfatase A-like enzyme
LAIFFCFQVWITIDARADQAERSLPNIVIIMVDDMGYGDPGCFNPDSKIATPHIDSIAKAGMRFTDAHAPGPLCHMSRYGLLTGKYPFRINVGLWPKRALIEPGQLTIASLAKSQGYHTAMIGKWHVGFNEEGYDKPLSGGPIDCGFDSYFGMRASTDIPPYFYIRGDRAVEPPTDHIDDEFSEDWSNIQGRRRLAGGIAPNLKLEDVLPRFTSEAIQVIQGHRAQKAATTKPLMLYLAYPAPHTPWLPSAEFDGKSGAGLYGDFAMMVDAEIGRVLEALQAAELFEDTLLVFTSDNGPCWYDVDVERFGHDSAGGLRGMKADAWEAGHRMPFIVRWPGHVKPDSRSDQTICFTDLLATFAALFQVELADDAGPDSFNLLPVLNSSQPAEKPIRAPFVMRAGSASTMMIRSGNWKLINQLGSGGFSEPRQVQSGPNDPAGQLYNLEDDRGESVNLYSEKPEIVARLQGEMKQIIDSGRSRSLKSESIPKENRETSAINSASQKSDQSDPTSPYTGLSEKGVDTTTLTGKVMCGYQGWFNCEGDNAQLGWKHWTRQRRKVIGPGNVTVDLWPDLSEFDPDEKYATGFKHADGRVAEVFSSANRKTVLRHFQWMQDYGIDGAFVQRFATDLRDEAVRRNNDQVLAHAREGANRAGRAYAVMYDLSGLGAGEVLRVREDWRRLRESMTITDDPAYLHHAGQPLVAIWGVGFSDNRKYSLEECHELVSALKADGCTVMLGVPTWWREGKRDATAAPLLLEILKLADIISPWTVGRYRSPQEASRHGETVWKFDLQWCQKHDKAFLPVVFPGFSWHNLHGGKLDDIPRLKGEFLWAQVEAAKKCGSQMIYVAMFDEVDEGTAIFKCTNDPPVGEGAEFMTYDGLPADHYLRLVGEAGKLLRDESIEK